MSSVTIKTGAFVQGKHLIVDASNARPPYAQGVAEVGGHLKVGTDFTSGYDVIIQLQAARDILFFDVKEKTGSTNTAFTNKDYVVSDMPNTTGNASGKLVTISNCTQDVLFFGVVKS